MWTKRVVIDFYCGSDELNHLFSYDWI